VGQMTWQFNEPWPNAQCSNVLEYYGGRKLAYYAVKEAYESVLTSLQYKKLFYTSGESFGAEIWLINDRPDSPFRIRYTVTAEDGSVLASGSFEGTATEDVSFRVGTIGTELPEDLTGSFSIRLDTQCGSFQGSKEYLMLMADLEIPVRLTAAEQKFLDSGAIRPDLSSLNAPRASTGSVIRYVDRWWHKISG